MGVCSHPTNSYSDQLLMFFPWIQTNRLCVFVFSGMGGGGLDEVILFEVELQDGVFDGGEDEADVLGVSGAGEV